jgi:hypothetical protein
MARKPKPDSPGRNGDNAAANADRRGGASARANENSSPQTNVRTHWFSAHEYTTSEDTLRTPKAEDKPGIGAPSARQERDAEPNESDAPASDHPSHQRPESSHERSSRIRRSPSARSRRDAAPRNRRPGPAR